MPNPFFSFKQFTVFHDKCAMKVGIDGVLLGAWADINAVSKILDVGTGSGLIALMLAQRSDATIDAIDIDSTAIMQATENIANSYWNNRIHVFETSLQEFALNNSFQYDLIVSNPPYFVNSTKTPLNNRTLARHTDTLSHEELILNAKKLLRHRGRICIILPYNEGNQCVDFALGNGLFCNKQTLVYPKLNSKPKRILLEFGLDAVFKTVTDLTIETNERHQYTNEFSLLAKDFYLKL